MIEEITLLLIINIFLSVVYTGIWLCNFWMSFSATITLLLISVMVVLSISKYSSERKELKGGKDGRKK